METLTQPKPLKSRILRTELANWREFQFIQQEDFKELPKEAKDKLKASILSNNFTQPFYVWQDETTGIIYCLDGKHRTMILEELSTEGHDIPYLLPATFVQCEDKKEAARLVLVYSSIYAKIRQQGLFDFLEQYDLNFVEVKETIDLPEFSMDRFEQKFDLFDVSGAEEPEVEVADADVIVKAGDLFEINGHRVICGSFRDEELVNRLMDGKKARILNCDPPYNLPANFFTNKYEKVHEDFAMGAGEMTDEEFVEFLALIMKRAVDNTVPGAIHYIFMDFRHIWHMTEAGRRVYGSPIPKQMCVWNKDMMANGSFYRAKHELCFVFNSPQGQALWNKDLIDQGGWYKDNAELVFIFKAGDDDVKHLSHLDLKDRIRTNVWNYPSATSMANPDRFELKNHPTPKPVQMIADAILDTTNDKDIVIDWFLGSGTCLIASDKTGRFCYATEIEPKYVQGDIIRYLNYCKKQGITVKFTHVNGSLTLNDFTNEQHRQ
jgi:hypothetical protein